MCSRGHVDQREGHVDALWQECRTGRHDGIRRAAQVAGVFDVASQPEKHAFAWEAFLVRKPSRVIAANVRSIADVSFAFKPQGYSSLHCNDLTADEHAVVMEADERTH